MQYLRNIPYNRIKRHSFRKVLEIYFVTDDSFSHGKRLVEQKYDLLPLGINFTHLSFSSIALSWKKEFFVRKSFVLLQLHGMQMIGNYSARIISKLIHDSNYVE